MRKTSTSALLVVTLWLSGCSLDRQEVTGLQALVAAKQRAESRRAMVHLPAATNAGIRNLPLQEPAVRLYLQENAIAFDNVQIVASWLQIEPLAEQREVLSWLVESDLYRQLRTEQAGQTSWSGLDWVHTRLSDFFQTAAPAERRLGLRFAGRRRHEPHRFALLADQGVPFGTLIHVAQSFSNSVSFIIDSEGDLLAMPVDVSDCRQAFEEWPSAACSTIVLETDGVTNRLLAAPATYRDPLGSNNVSDICVRPSWENARELARSTDPSALLDASRAVPARCGVVAVEVLSNPSWERIAVTLQVAALMSERNHVQVAMRTEADVKERATKNIDRQRK
ncbi:MAG: hypothetical protein IT381_13865 [Deltaproteobacteria bacterium]|nr:hypothetical protein [Deltaproteobacteria bacterium]